MEKYKYKAINASGRPVYGTLGALNENDLFNQLQASGLELVKCNALSQKKTSTPMFAKVKIRDLIQFFMHLDQLEGAGISILDALADVRDTTDNATLRDCTSEIFRDVTEGAKLSEAMAKHPKIFQTLHISLVASGEQTGKMRLTYQQLIKYLKWVDSMETKVRKATRYPMVLLIVVILAIVVMMGFVVPQIVEFIKNMDFELPFPTIALIATSDFFQSFWYIVLAVPVIIFGIIFSLYKASESFAYKIDSYAIKAPTMGVLIRKINIARFCQTFSALFASGLPILQSMTNATQTVSNRALAEALGGIQDQIKEGKTIAEAFNSSGEFPSMVIRMLKIGQDSGNMSGVLDQVSEFYTNDVDEEVQKLISMIEPSLTVVLGGMILWIAVGVFGPIYGSFENMQF